jgi:hypothetical protein
MPGSACYDSNSSEKVIKYNIDKYESIISIEHTFEQIYNQYISSGKLNIKNKEYGTWVNYNNDDEKYYIRFSYLFTIKTDYSTLPACKYFTTRFSEFPAKEYHYANKSSCDTCSHPTIVENSNNEISLCHYRLSVKSFSICPLYTEDILHTSSYKIKSKFSEETFVITSKAYRSNDSSKVIASIYQTLPDETEIVIQTISLDTLSYVLCVVYTIKLLLLLLLSDVYWNINYLFPFFSDVLRVFYYKTSYNQPFFFFFVVYPYRYTSIFNYR